MNSFPVMLGGRRGRSWTPARLGAALLNWFEAVPGSVANSGVAATNGGALTDWIDRRDTIASQTHAKLTATGAGLLFDQTNKGIKFDGTNYLTLGTPETIGQQPYGTPGLSVYIVGSPATWRGIGGSADGSDKTAFFVSGGQLEIADNTSNAQTNNNGTYTGGLFRMIASGQFNTRLAGSGITEGTDTLGGSFTFALTGADSFNGSATPSPANSLLKVILVIQQDTVAAGTDSAIRAYLAGRFGVSL